MRRPRPPMRSRRVPRPVPPTKDVAIAATAINAEDAKARMAAAVAAVAEKVAENNGRVNRAVSAASVRSAASADRATKTRNADRVLSSKVVRNALQESLASPGKHVSPEKDAAPANPDANSVLPKRVPMRHRRRCLLNSARNRLSQDRQGRMANVAAGAEVAAVAKVVKAVRTVASSARGMPSAQNSTGMHQHLRSLWGNQLLPPWQPQALHP